MSIKHKIVCRECFFLSEYIVELYKKQESLTYTDTQIYITILHFDFHRLVVSLDLTASKKCSYLS